MPPEPGYIKFSPNRGMIYEGATYVFLCIHEDERVFVTETPPGDDGEAADPDLMCENRSYWLRMWSKHDKNIRPDSADKILPEDHFQLLIDMFYDDDGNYTEQSRSNTGNNTPARRSPAPAPGTTLRRA